MAETRHSLYREAQQLGYTGNLKYSTSTKAQWSQIVDGLRAQVIQPRGISLEEQEPKEQKNANDGIEQISDRIPELHYTPFNVLDDLGMHELTADNADAFKDIVKEKYDEVVGQLPNDTHIQVVVIGTSGMTFSSKFYADKFNPLRDIWERIDEYAGRYDGSGSGYALDVSTVAISYMANQGERIRGMHRSIASANDKWFIIDTPTRVNCVYVSIETGLRWRNTLELLVDKNRRIQIGKKHKNEDGLFADDAPTMQDIEKIAKFKEITIKIYDNIFTLTHTFEYGKRVVEIQVANYHAMLLIPKKDVIDISPEFAERLSHPELEPKPGIEKKPRAKPKKNIVIHKTDDKIISKSNDEKRMILYDDDDYVARPVIRKKATASEINQKYITWDLETYTESKENTTGQIGADKEFIVYCSGLSYYTTPTTEFPDGIAFKQWYGDDNNLQFFADFIKENIDWLENYTFYAHNGGKFDLVILIRDIFQHDKEFEIIGKKFVELNGALIGFSVKYNGKEIKFKDSYRIFQSSLKKTTQSMKVKHVKTDIDHNLITKNTFMKYKDEVVEYHKIDCVGLLECIKIISDATFKEFKLNITDCFTAASLSKKISLSKFMSKQNIYLLTPEEDTYIRKSYQGGRNECFYLGGVNDKLYYYDFTSLYPSEGRKQLPTGIPVFCDYKDKSIDNVLLTNRIGFVRCVIRGTHQMLNGKKPLHGHIRDGKFMFEYFETPTEMTLSVVEIRYGLKLGYTYQPIDGYEFIAGYVMRDFFNHCFKHKAEARANNDEATEYMWKIILNSGYGFWGYNPHNKDTVRLYSRNGRGWIKALHENRLTNLGQFKNYIISREMNDKLPIDTNVAIASTITAYARCTLHIAISDIEKCGGIVYYCDTDSIMTNLKLSDYPELVKKYRPDGMGKELGGLKNELGLSANNEDLAFDKLTIVGCKMYSCMGVNSRGKTIIFNKLKGYQKDFKDEDFEDGDQQKELLQKQMLESLNIEKMNNGEMLSQEQLQFLINKNDYIRETDQWNIRINRTTKQFKKFYNKGIVSDTGFITPFTL